MNFFTRKSNTKSIKKEEKHTFEDYFRMFDRLYGVFGVRPFLKTKTNKFFDVYVKVYRLALVIVSLNWAYGSIVKIFEPKLQFFLKVPHFAFLFYVFEGVFKYSVASFNHKAIVDVIETLREMYLKHELANTVKLSPDAPYYEIVYWQAKKGYQEKLQSTGKLIKLSIIGWLMAGVSYIIMPILVVIIRLIITGDLKPQYGLDTTYLIDFHGKWVLIMIVEDIYEASADINLAIPDGVICMIINHISANFEVLGADFQRLLNSKGISYTEKLDKVGEIIQRHNDLIKLSDTTHDIYTVAYFMKYFTCSFLMCMVGLTIVTIPDKTQLILFGPMLTALLAQITLLCHIGEVLSTASTDVSDIAYDSYWYEQDTRIQKYLQLFTLRSLRPCKMTAMNFVDINKETLKNILNTTYSYFTLLYSFID